MRFPIFILCLAVRAVSIDWYRIHISRYLNHSVDPCNNFFRHACPTGMVANNGIRQKSATIFSFWTDEGLKSRKYDDPTEFFATIESLLPKLSEPELRYITSEVFFLNALHRRHALFNYTKGRLRNLPIIEETAEWIIKHFQNSNPPIYREQIFIPFIDDSAEDYFDFMELISNSYANHMRNVNRPYFTPTDVWSRIVEFSNALKVAVTPIIEDLSDLQREAINITGRHRAQNGLGSIVIGETVLAPFFYDIDDASMIAAFGFTLAHEIIHSYVTDESSKTYYKQYAECVTNTSANFCEMFREKGMCESGSTTFIEDAADLEGIKIAYRLLHYLGKSKGEAVLENNLRIPRNKLFFYTYAATHCSDVKMSEQQMGEYGIFDPHSANFVRVNFPLSQMDEFRKTFNCSKSSKMTSALCAI